MEHVKSQIKMVLKKGVVKVTVKETYKDNAGGKMARTHDAGEYDLNNDNIEDIVSGHAESWIKGDWIEEEAFE